MTLPTTADFNNAKRDLDDLAEIVTSPTVKDVPKRLGGNTPTLSKVMSETTDFLATQTQRLADRDAEIDQTLVRLRDHAPVRNRGAWITGTTYEVNDIWQAASDVWYVVVQEYVSGATDIADVASGKVFVHQVNIVADMPADTIADLRLFEPSQDGQHKNVTGHTFAGSGGGPFYYDASDTTSPDNDGTVIVTASGKRWKRSGAGIPTLEKSGAADHAGYAVSRKGAGVSNKCTHIIAGIDSLTQGYFTGDDFGYGPIHSHFSEFIKLASSTIGNSGGYFSIVAAQAARFGADIGAGSGFLSLANLPTSDSRRMRSFDFNGLAYPSSAWLSGKSIYWTSNRNWKKQKVFFLRQGGGGGFEVDHISEVGYRYSVDTSKASAGLGLGDSVDDLLAGEYELDYIEIGKMEGGSDQVKLRHTHDGEMCVYGVLTDDDNGGCKYTFQSNSGYKVKDYVDNLDPATMKTWYQILEPSHYMLNGGTNDRSDSSVLDFESDYIELIDRIKTGSYSGALSIESNVICISPNDIVDKGAIEQFRKSIYQIAAANGYGYLDHMQFLGSVNDATELGFMLDGTHPGYKGIPILALADCDYFGLSAGKYSLPDGYILGSSGLFNYAGSLRAVATGQVSAGNTVEIYNIGLADATDFIHFNLKVVGQRTSQNTFRSKAIELAIRNDGVGSINKNKVTFLVAGTETETLGNASAINFTINTSIVADRLIISITCIGNTQNFSARADWFGRSLYTGDIVYENETGDLSSVSYSGDGS